MLIRTHHPSRRNQYSDLPGSVGGAFRKPSSVHFSARPAQKALNPVPESTHRASPIAEEVPPVPRVEEAVPAVTVRQAQEESHWVYGTAAVDVAEVLADGSAGSAVAKAGERMLLCYPMTSDEDGNVFMHCKTAHPATAQMGLHKVMVHAPSEAVAYRVRDFSFFP